MILIIHQDDKNYTCEKRKKSERFPKYPLPSPVGASGATSKNPISTTEVVSNF